MSYSGIRAYYGTTLGVVEVFEIGDTYIQYSDINTYNYRKNYTDYFMETVITPLYYNLADLQEDYPELFI